MNKRQEIDKLIAEVKKQINYILTAYTNDNFKDNVKNLLLTTNKLRKELPINILSSLIKEYNHYCKNETEENLYKTKDSIICLYNYLL